MVDTKGRHMMRLATKAGSAIPNAVRKPSPPHVIPVVTCHQEWSGRSPWMGGADRGPQLSVTRDQQILVKEVPIDAHAIHELGQVCARLVRTTSVEA